MEETVKNKKDNQEVVDFDFKEFILFCLKRWYWFVLCMAFAVGIALFYVYRKQPEYKRYEQILINDQDSGGGIGEVSSAFSSLGLFSKNSNVYNELLTITSPAVMYQVVDTLKLYMGYTERDGLRSKTLYGLTQPFIVEMPDIERQGSASFRMKLDPNGDMELFKFIRYIPTGKIKYPDIVKAKAGTNLIETPLGRISIQPNPNFIPDEKVEEKVIDVSKTAVQNAVEYYSLKLNGDLADEDADIIELSIEDVSVQRAEDILNFILLIYNQDWVNDKNKMANATSKFINERLKIIQSELGDVDQSIADYLKESGTPDMTATLTAKLELSSKMEETYISTNNDLTMAQYMKEFLQKNNNITTILPANLGMDNRELNVQITTYNDLLLERNNILSNSSYDNPLVQNYDRQLTQMRSAIENSIDNQIAALQNAMENIREEIDRMNTSMANTPADNLPLLSEERQQKVKEALYLFLLQKREENELTQKFISDNFRIITPPVGPLKPVSPKKGLIIIVALIIGLGAPLIILYYLESTDTTVRNKKDLDVLTMSFAGEVPQVGKKPGRRLFGKPIVSKQDIPPLAVVEDGNRNFVNEAFRVIRGNLEFMGGKQRGHEVVMITSFNPGSGKSFIAYNLGLSFALRNKKVLIIDCDLRHGSSSMFVDSPSKGLSTYLTGTDSNWEGLVKQTSNRDLWIMPIGKVPPNPAELLAETKMEELVEQAKDNYDIILLDCPPVNMVVDTQALAHLADRTLFIVRAGMLEKSALKEINELHEEKKYNNISVILNGTEPMKGKYTQYGAYHY